MNRKKFVKIAGAVVIRAGAAYYLQSDIHFPEKYSHIFTA